MDSDKSSADRADAAASRNVLSGTAKTAAQVQTVYGGVHMYETPSSREKTRHHRRLANGTRITTVLAVVAIVLSIIALLLEWRHVALSVAATVPAPTSHTPSRQVSEYSPKIGDISIPPHRENDRQDYLLKLPEIASVHAFQAYTCNGKTYHQMLIGTLWTPKRGSAPASVARAYGDNFAAAAWNSNAFSHYLPPQHTSRSAYGGNVVYPGVAVFGSMPLGPDARCGTDVVMIGVLILDTGEGYCVFAVLIGTSTHLPGGEHQAEQDVRLILDSIVVTTP